MTPSDWIAIGALCLSALALCVSVFISILGFVFNYYTNRQNIKARRAEIVTEKSLEIYRQLIARLNLVIKIGNDAVPIEDKPREFEKAYEDYKQFIADNMLYFPSSITLEIGKMQDEIFNLLEAKGKADENTLPTIGSTIWSKEFVAAINQYEKLLLKLQNYIGLEQK